MPRAGRTEGIRRAVLAGALGAALLALLVGVLMRGRSAWSGRMRAATAAGLPAFCSPY